MLFDIILARSYKNSHSVQTSKRLDDNIRYRRSAYCDLHYTWQLVETEINKNTNSYGESNNEVVAKAVKKK